MLPGISCDPLWEKVWTTMFLVFQLKCWNKANKSCVKLHKRCKKKKKLNKYMILGFLFHTTSKKNKKKHLYSQGIGQQRSSSHSETFYWLQCGATVPHLTANDSLTSCDHGSHRIGWRFEQRVPHKLSYHCPCWPALHLSQMKPWCSVSMWFFLCVESFLQACITGPASAHCGTDSGVTTFWGSSQGMKDIH